MEIIIGLVVVAVIAYFVFRRNSKVEAAVAPYKVEVKAEVAKVEEEVVAVVKKAKATVKKATTRKPKAK